MAILTASGRAALAAAIKEQTLHLALGEGDPLWDTPKEMSTTFDENGVITLGFTHLTDIRVTSLDGQTTYLLDGDYSANAREGVIRLWNRGAERIFGRSAAETVGGSMDFIIPEKLRARHWEGYFRTMETGATKYGADTLNVPALTAGGNRISIEFTVVLLRDAGGVPSGVAAIIRDVTARREKELDLRGRLAELEKAVKA